MTVDRASRLSVAWWLAFLVPFVLLAIHHWSWQPSQETGDYAQYLSHARALAEGRAYDDIGYIYHPGAWSIGPRVYPPGLPLVLAPIVALDGVHSPFIRVLQLVSVALFAYCAMRRLARDVEPWQVAAGAGFAVFAIEAALGTIVPESDVGFCALLWATILMVDSTDRWTWPRVAAIAALGFAAIAFRVAGIALIPALGAWALLTWHRHRGRAAIPAALWSVAGLTALVTGMAPIPAKAELVNQIAALPWRGPQLWHWYSPAILQVELYPFSLNSWNDFYHLIASPFLVIGVVMLLWRMRQSFLAAFTVGYALLLVLAPVAEVRYVRPLFPLLVAGFALGVQRAIALVVRARRHGDRTREWNSPARIAAVAIFALVLIGAFFVERSHPKPRSLADNPLARETLAWIRDRNAREPLRVAYANPRLVTLETRASAMGLVQRTAPGVLLSFVEKGITHFVWQRHELSGCLQRIANTLPASHPDRFTLEFSNPDFRVYRVVSNDRPLDQKFERIRWNSPEEWCPP